MITARLIAFIFMASGAALFSCNSKTSEPASSTEKQSEAATATPKGKYAIKSGIVECKTQMMGMDMKQVLSIDDYGNKDVTKVMAEMMGTKIHTVTIHKNGFVYICDMVKKPANKVHFAKAAASDIDFENLSDEMVKDMNLKKDGTAEFLGKTY